MALTTLVNAANLFARLNDPRVVIVDCRFTLNHPDAGRQAYAVGHVPGARYADLETDLSGQILPGSTGRHPLPTVHDFQETVSNWGVSNDDQVVCYDGSGGAFAARLWWMFKWVGHENVAVLNGGWPAWLDSGYPVSNDLPVVKPTPFTGAERAELVVSSHDVEDLRSNPAWILLDARAPERYRGDIEPLDPVAGHIPGALSVPFKGNLRKDGTFEDGHTLRQRYRNMGIESSVQNVATYCGSGVTAAHNVLAMEHAGLGMAKLYPGSWSEWITDPARAVIKGEN